MSKPTAIDGETGSLASMPKFKVPIDSETPAETARDLDAHEIPHIGPAAAGFVDSSSSWTLGTRMTAVFEATDAEAAEARVRQAIGDECEIGPVEPFGSDAQT
jgi:hypothetical protein